MNGIAGMGQMSAYRSASTMVDMAVVYLGCVVLRSKFGRVWWRSIAGSSGMRTIEVAETDMMWPFLHFFPVSVPESTSMFGIDDGEVDVFARPGQKL